MRWNANNRMPVLVTTPFLATKRSSLSPGRFGVGWQGTERRGGAQDRLFNPIPDVSNARHIKTFFFQSHLLSSPFFSVSLL